MTPPDPCLSGFIRGSNCMVAAKGRIRGEKDWRRTAKVLDGTANKCL
jgi:hypothetical protein